MTRFFQVILIVSVLALSWLLFMVVHEFGHVVTGWLTGGSVSLVVLHPLRISWTSFSRDPHPQITAWGGPVLGSVVPLAILAGVRFARSTGTFVFRFFAGFCLVANGMYLLIDSLGRGGDGGVILRHGGSQWALLLFGLIATPTGLWLWNGLGPSFGLGVALGRVSRTAALTCLVLLVVTVAAELAFYPL